MPVSKGHGGFGRLHVHPSCLQAVAVGKQARTGELHCTEPETLIQMILRRHEAATVFATAVPPVGFVLVHLQARQGRINDASRIRRGSAQRHIDETAVLPVLPEWAGTDEHHNQRDQTNLLSSLTVARLANSLTASPRADNSVTG
jgi:hypothetical protein